MIESLGMIRTNKGRMLQAKVQAGTELQYTRMAFGSGRTEEDIRELTGLVDERLSARVQPAKVLSDSEVQVTGVLTNDGLELSFKVQEIGVFADDPDEGEILYAYTQAIDEDSGGTIPAGGGVTRIEQKINLLVSVDDADVVNISPVGTDPYVLWDDFRADQQRQDLALEAHNADPHAHPDLREQLAELFGMFNTIGAVDSYLGASYFGATYFV